MFRVIGKSIFFSTLRANFALLATYNGIEPSYITIIRDLVAKGRVVITGEFGVFVLTGTCRVECELNLLCSISDQMLVLDAFAQHSCVLVRPQLPLPQAFRYNATLGSLPFRAVDSIEHVAMYTPGITQHTYLETHGVILDPPPVNALLSATSHLPTYHFSIIFLRGSTDNLFDLPPCDIQPFRGCSLQSSTSSLGDATFTLHSLSTTLLDLLHGGVVFDSFTHHVVAAWANPYTTSYKRAIRLQDLNATFPNKRILQLLRGYKNLTYYRCEERVHEVYQLLAFERVKTFLRSGFQDDSIVISSSPFLTKPLKTHF